LRFGLASQVANGLWSVFASKVAAWEAWQTEDGQQCPLDDTAEAPATAAAIIFTG